MCVCPTGFTGTNCSIRTNPCNPQPCFHNGTCIANGTQSYTCICPTDYFGTRCEICNCACTIYPCRFLLVVVVVRIQFCSRSQWRCMSINNKWRCHMYLSSWLYGCSMVCCTLNFGYRFLNCYLF
jgi:hypothetical protein